MRIGEAAEHTAPARVARAEESGPQVLAAAAPGGRQLAGCPSLHVCCFCVLLHFGYNLFVVYACHEARLGRPDAFLADSAAHAAAGGYVCCAAAITQTANAHLASLRQVFDEVRITMSSFARGNGRTRKVLHHWHRMFHGIEYLARAASNQALSICFFPCIPKYWLWLQVARFINSRTDPLLV